MPTPLEILRDPAMQVVLAMLAGLALWERLAPGRPLPRVRGWLTLKERKAIHQFFHGAIPAAEIAKKFRVSIPTIYNHARAGY